MKKIVLAIAAAAFATSAMATPARPKCLYVCPPIVEELEQFDPASPEETEPTWFEELLEEPFQLVTG
jgi:hypothetical protein